MVNIGIIFVAVCLIGFLIYAWLRFVPLPPNASLLFDAWAAVAGKTNNDDMVSPKKNRNV